MSHNKSSYNLTTHTIITVRPEEDAEHLSRRSISEPNPSRRSPFDKLRTGFSGRTDEHSPYNIVIIGTGPRGIIVLERLLALAMQDQATPTITIYAIDSTEVGCGRVWRTDQPDYLLMDNSTNEITLFSGPMDQGPARPGHGPTFEEWICLMKHECTGLSVGPVFYPARKTYGEYLKFVFECMVNNLPNNVRLFGIKATVTSIKKQASGFMLACTDNTSLYADKIVLCTGHATHALDEERKSWDDFAQKYPNVSYLAPEPALELTRTEVPEQTRVGILGLGLSFYDVLMMLTVGRGGQFVSCTDGSLRYEKSGLEPSLIVAGSRSGLTIPVRGIWQKQDNAYVQTTLFTKERILELRKSKRLDFRVDVYPWIEAELNHVYFSALLEKRSGKEVSTEFNVQVLKHVSNASMPLQALESIIQRFGMSQYPLLSLEKLAYPFQGQTYATPDEFTQAFKKIVQEDVSNALEGNVNNPLKAAFEMLRDTRFIQRLAVDYSGLSPDAHREFVQKWCQTLSFFSAGTPIPRAKQLLALIECGLVHMVGPNITIRNDDAMQCYALSSPQVMHSEVAVDILIDARLSKTNITQDCSPLTQQLLGDGIWNSYVNPGENAYDTGGVAVTTSPFHPINQHNTPDPNLYVFGIPTEHIRWFMQVGIIRPKHYASGLGQDALEIAHDIWSAVLECSPLYSEYT